MNDEARMSNNEGNLNDEVQRKTTIPRAFLRHSSLVIHHSDFGIPALL